MMRYFVFKSSSHGISEIRLREAACTAENLGIHFQVNVAIIDLNTRLNGGYIEPHSENFHELLLTSFSQTTKTKIVVSIAVNY